MLSSQKLKKMNFILLSYPTISDAIADFTGVYIPLPIQTYGFFVALAFVTAGIIISYEYKIREKSGLMPPIYKTETIGEPAKISDIVTAFLIAFLVGFKLIELIKNYNDFSINPQDFILSTRGSIGGGLLFGIIAAAYNWYDKNKQKLAKPKTVIVKMMPHQITGNLMVLVGITGLFGAKIFHNLENFDRFLADPIGELFSFSGLTFFGGLIVGGFAGNIYLKKNNINVYHTIDSSSPAIAAGYAIGRIGCAVSGDGCWGIPNPKPAPSFIPDWLWSYNYPHNVVNDGIKIADCAGQHCRVLPEGVFPTSIYETLMMTTIFVILILLRKKINFHTKFPGMLFGIYLTLQGVERMLIEQIRVNNKFKFLTLEVTQAEIIATLLIISGITVIYLTHKFNGKIKEKCKPVEKIPDIKAEIITKE